MVLLAHDAVTPSGKPVTVPMFVAPVVVWAMSVSVVLIHIVGVEEAAVTVLVAVIVIVPSAFTVPQPPVNGMV